MSSLTALSQSLLRLPRTAVLGYSQPILSKLAFLWWFYPPIIDNIAWKRKPFTLSSRTAGPCGSLSIQSDSSQ